LSQTRNSPESGLPELELFRPPKKYFEGTHLPGMAVSNRGFPRHISTGFLARSPKIIPGRAFGEKDPSSGKKMGANQNPEREAPWGQNTP